MRADEGVRDGFLGIVEGERESDLASVATGGGGGGMLVIWPMGWGGGGIMDIRFIRRVSVGLMVRAPRPLAWAE